jgi:hypothetical protein
VTDKTKNAEVDILALEVVTRDTGSFPATHSFAYGCSEKRLTFDDLTRLSSDQLKLLSDRPVRLSKVQDATTGGILTVVLPDHDLDEEDQDMDVETMKENTKECKDQDDDEEGEGEGKDDGRTPRGREGDSAGGGHGSGSRSPQRGDHKRSRTHNKGQANGGSVSCSDSGSVVSSPQPIGTVAFERSAPSPILSPIPLISDFSSGARAQRQRQRAGHVAVGSLASRTGPTVGYQAVYRADPSSDDV